MALVLFHFPKQQKSASSLLLPISLGLILSFANVGKAQAANESAPMQLTKLEEAIRGVSSPQLSISMRIQLLEKEVFSKEQHGSLSSRISALQKFAGIGQSPAPEKKANKSKDSSKSVSSSKVSSTESAYMPPLPPQFDANNDALKSPPDTVSTRSASLRDIYTKKAARTSKTLANIGSGANAAKRDGESFSKLEEAIRLHQDGKVFEAEDSLKKIFEKDPRNADAAFSLGAIAEARGDLNKALDYYTTAMQANPIDDEARNAVAEVSRRITIGHAIANQNQNGPFINPLAPPSDQVLQGHALELGQNNSPYSGQAAFTSPPVGTLTVGNPNQAIPVAPVSPSNKSLVGRSIARAVARAAIGAALSQTGLHCPACALLRGF